MLPLLAAAVSVTIVGFSDYHSHALPFYTDGRPGQAGLARAVAFLKSVKAQPNSLVFSGGDMLNLATPAWSDEYRCVEWPWLSGLVDAMALGNHDVDYGPAELERCRASARFPVLSANLLREDGAPYFTAEGKPYLVREVAGVRIGAFALAGPDVQKLVKQDRLPAGTHWADATETARQIVATLRGPERVDAVVLFGHQQQAKDEALARAVPGIDLILGSHSHLKAELAKIPGTNTWFVSPSQYLTYVSRVRLGFDGRRLVAVEGGLVRMDSERPEDPQVAAQVAEKQAALEKRRPDRFRVVGQAATALSDDGVFDAESLLSDWATDTLRARAEAHVFFATASSFRGTIPAGPVVAETLLTAVPYKNAVVVARLTGEQVRAWIALSATKRGSDFFSPASGVRYVLGPEGPASIEVLKDPGRPENGFVALDATASYRVATTDYQGFVAAGYKEIFAAGQDQDRAGLDVQEVLLDALATGVGERRLDGRVRLSP